MGQVRSKFFASGTGSVRRASDGIGLHILTSKPQFDTCKSLTRQYGLSATISKGYTHDNYALSKTGHLPHRFELNQGQENFSASIYID